MKSCCGYYKCSLSESQHFSGNRAVTVGFALQLHRFLLKMRYFMMNAESVYKIFLLFFVFSTALQLYLSVRQSRAVLRHRSEVPHDFIETVTLAEHQVAADYTLAKQRLARYRILYDSILLMIFTLGGGLNTLAAVSAKLSDGPITQGVWLITLFVLISTILSLPFDAYATFKLEGRFGFNRSTPATFFIDRIKGLLLGAIIGIPLLYAAIYLMGVTGHSWWLWVWLLWLGFSLFLLWAFPKWIAPLFNKFEPLPEGPLKAQIESLLDRTGFQSNGISLWMAAGVQVTAMLILPDWEQTNVLYFLIPYSKICNPKRLKPYWHMS